MVDDAQIRDVMTLLGNRRWASKTAAEKREHAMMMVEARRRKARARKRGKKAKAL